MPEIETLAHFIRKNLEPITEAWRDFAATLSPGTTDFVLRNHIHPILFFIADDIEQLESEQHREIKSQGHIDDAKHSPSESHAKLRYNAGFDIVEMVAEYRALRASVIRLWTEERTLNAAHIHQMIRFNEAIDQLLAQSVESFVKKLRQKQEVV